MMDPTRFIIEALQTGTIMPLNNPISHYHNNMEDKNHKIVN